MSPELIAALAGAILSLVLELFPFLQALWDKVNYEYKPLIMFVLCLATPFALAGLACADVANVYGATCPTVTREWYELATLGFLAFLANQATFKYVSKSNSTKFLYGKYMEQVEADKKAG